MSVRTWNGGDRGARWWVVIRHCMWRGENFIGGQVGENLPSEKYLPRPDHTRNTLPYGVPITARFRTSLLCVPGGHAKWVSYGSAGLGPLQHNLVCPVVSRRPHLRSDKYKQPPFQCPFHIALSPSLLLLCTLPLYIQPVRTSPNRPNLIYCPGTAQCEIRCDIKCFLMNKFSKDMQREYV